MPYSSRLVTRVYDSLTTIVYDCPFLQEGVKDLVIIEHSNGDTKPIQQYRYIGGATSLNTYTTIISPVIYIGLENKTSAVVA